MKTKVLSLHLRSVALAALAGIATANAQTVTNGLQVYLNFDNNINAQGGTTINGSIYSSPSGATAKYVTGISGQAASFNNTGISGQPTDWAVTLGSLETVYSNSFSYSLWVQTTSTTDATVFGNKSWASGANAGWSVNTTPTKTVNWDTVGGSTTYRHDVTLNPPFDDGNWHLVTVTWNRTANLVLIYLDGTLSSTNVSTTLGIGSSGSASLNAGYPTLIGSSGSGVYSGTANIDDLGIWNRLLAPEEIAALYAKGTNGQSLVGQVTPFFVQQPQGGTRYTSDSGFTLSCLVADDRGPLTFQWYQGSTLIATTTNRTFVVTNLTVGTTNYSIVVNDGVGNITSAPAALTVLPANSITQALVVCLNFDNNIDAQGGTTNAGTATGPNTPHYMTGQIGAAAYFTNTYANVTPTDWAASLGNLEWVYSNNFSFSLWVNLTNNTESAVMGNKDWNYGSGYSGVGWIVAPYNSWDVSYVPLNATRQNIGGFVRDGLWHHVATVFNRDANLVSVYVDGNVAATAPLGITGWESLAPTTYSPPNTLVGSSGTGKYSASGVGVDDLGMWARTLTSDEILAIYAQGLQGQALTTAVAGSAIRPTISTQPQSETKFIGRKASFSVGAAGSAPLSYHWYQNGSLVAGASTSTLVFNPVAATNAGSYTVVVTNSYGSVTSSPPATLTVLAVTNVTSGLAVYLNFDDNINAQGSTTNSGTAIGANSPTYTPGRIGDSALFNNSATSGQPSDWAVALGNIEWIYADSFAFSLWVNVTNGVDGALFGNKDWTSGANAGWAFDPYRSGLGGTKGFLNYLASLSVRQDLGGAVLNDGAWHHVVANFDRDINWVSVYVDGSLTSATNLAALGTEALTPNNVSPNNTLIGSSGNGNYSGAGAVDDLGVWTRPLSTNEIVSIFVQGIQGQPLTTASLNPVGPAFASQPQSQTRGEGLTASFSATAGGTPTLSYQWRRDGVNLSGETGTALTFPTALSDSGAAFTVVVSNPYGSVTSSPPAILTVAAAPAVMTNQLVVYLNFESNILGQADTTIDGTAFGGLGQEVYTNGIIGQYAALFQNDDSSTTWPSDWAVALGDIEWLYATNWTISLWINTTNQAGAFVGNKDWTYGANIGWVISEYYANFLNYTPVNAGAHYLGNSAWADGNWHHVAAVFYRDANLVYTYVDGALTAQGPLGLTGQESLTPGLVGGNSTLVGSSGDAAYSGAAAIDDLGMWARPLSPAEMAGIYQAGTKGLGIPQAAFGTPSLSALHSGTNILLTYPAWAKGYVLESSGSLSPASWGTLGATPALVGSNAVVTLPASSGNVFLRLRH